jgi:hypothetical protein
MDSTARKRPRDGLDSTDELRNVTPRHLSKRTKFEEDHDAQSCHFMRLPRELRDMVYHYLWTYTPLITELYPQRTSYNNSQPALSITYGFIDEDGQLCLASEALPRWILVSKTFLGEGMEQLRSKGYWDVQNCGRLKILGTKMF